MQTDAIVKDELDNLVDDIRSALRAAQIGYRDIGVQGNRAGRSRSPTRRRRRLAQAKLNDVRPAALGRGLRHAAPMREFDADDGPAPHAHPRPTQA